MIYKCRLNIYKISLYQKALPNFIALVLSLDPLERNTDLFCGYTLPEKVAEQLNGDKWKFEYWSFVTFFGSSHFCIFQILENIHISSFSSYVWFRGMTGQD